MFTENAYFEIETDGRVVSQSRDPPGQRSVYIPPGDTCRELYRLSTFKNFPRDSPMDPRRLVSSGFYFTGYKDRVKCFSCGQTTEHWSVVDDPGAADWHAPDCDFFSGRRNENEPIHGSFLRLGFSSSSGQNGSSSSTAQQSTRQVAHNPQQTQHNFSKQNYAPGSRLTSNGQPENRSLTPPRSEANNDALDLSVDFDTNSSASHLHELFPCLNPVNPHMQSSEARMQTFIEHPTEWFLRCINATPRDIVQAGMFYLGERDRVKCWYCNGGLQNWRTNDIPWEEHAKWFPMCEFVLQSKGPQYVQSIVSRFPNLRRPVISNPANDSHFSLPNSLLFLSTPQTSHNILSSSPIIIDPKKENEKLKQRINKDLTSSELVAKVKQMGFDESVIKAALKRRYEEYDAGFTSVENLIQSIIAFDNSSQNLATPNEHQLDAEEPIAQRPGNCEPLNGAAMLHELENSRNCRLCRHERANVVFIPCGHLVACETCSASRRVCPVCQSFIREKVRSYIS